MNIEAILTIVSISVGLLVTLGSGVWYLFNRMLTNSLHGVEREARERHEHNRLELNRHDGRIILIEEELKSVRLEFTRSLLEEFRKVESSISEVKGGMLVVGEQLRSASTEIGALRGKVEMASIRYHEGS